MVAESHRNLGAHVPVGVGDGLFRRRLRHGLHRCLAERSARGGQHDLLHTVRALEVEHLVDGVVLRIDREQRRPAALDLGQHERAGADQALLVGKPDDGSLRGRRECGAKPGRADDPCHDEIGGRGCSLDQGVRSCSCRRLGAGERFLEGAVERGVADDGLLGADRARLLGEALHAALGGQCLDLERSRMAGDQVDGVAADRARRTQDGDAPGCRSLGGGRKIRLWRDVDGRVHRRHSQFPSSAEDFASYSDYLSSPLSPSQPQRPTRRPRDPRRRRTT